MSTDTQLDIFDSLDQSGNDAAAMVQRMVIHFRTAQRPIELFEALKMRVRQQLGLPLIAPEDEPRIAEDVDRQLETGLLDACREVGELLIKKGRVREGWMYIRPTGDLTRAAELLADIEATDENAEELIQVMLHEGVDVGRGFQLLLDRNGTCNSITAYEQQISMRGKRDRQAAARRLLDHFYAELSAAIRGDIVRNEAPAADDETLGQMLDKRKWLVTDGGYHLDTTHLSSVIRIARVLEDTPSLQRALELCQYGRRLNHQFQYPGDEPFVDFYPAHSAYYNVLLGRDVDRGLELFERKATQADPQQVGTGPMEVYVELLHRCGKPEMAIDAAIRLAPDDVPTQRLVPYLIEIASTCGHFGPLLELCRRRGDVLGFAAASVAAMKLRVR